MNANRISGNERGALYSFAASRRQKQSCAVKRLLWLCGLCVLAVLVSEAAAAPGQNSVNALSTDNELSDYFASETAALSRRCLADIHSLNDWEARRGEYRRQLQEMLGLWPEPERTDLKPVITGKLEQADFVVEKLYLQALPRLYVTANLYRPRKLEQPAPAILYVCGHSRVATNGVSFGNKTRRAAQALKALPEFKPTPLCLRAQGEMGVNAAYAALFEPQIQKLELERRPASHAQGPDYLNVLKVGDIPQVLALLGSRAEVPGD